jgi:hypothetical protein
MPELEKKEFFSFRALAGGRPKRGALAACVSSSLSSSLSIIPDHFHSTGGVMRYSAVFGQLHRQLRPSAF